MKAKFAYYAQWLREGAVCVIRAYPVELLLAIYACVYSLVAYEYNLKDTEELALVPLFFALALTANCLAGRGPWRKVYWVCWTPLLPLSLLQGLAEWVGSAPFFISLFILSPLAVLVSLRAVRNERFVSDTVVWLRAAVLAVLFAELALGLFYAVFFSMTYIFGLDGRWTRDVAAYAFILTNTLALPTLFLMMSDRWRGADCRGGRVVEVLLNYIVTPALVAYAAVFYIYMAKILITWTLPEGGVAYLVFGFTVAALVVKAFQHLLDKRIYDWFFDRFSLVSLPMLVLFWIGVVRRTNEYGLTTMRVYLLACGLLMTLCVVLFLSKRLGRYLWVCLAAWVCFAALAYVPALEPERMAVRSQAHRAERLARALGRLDARGRLLLSALSPADTVYRKEYRKLYEALEYIRHDSAAFAPFGVKDLHDFTAIFPERMGSYVQWGTTYADTSSSDDSFAIELPDNAALQADRTYTRYYTNLNSWSEEGYVFQDDTLRIRLDGRRLVFQITGAELLRRQIAASGFRPEKEAVPTADERLRMLDYRDQRIRILIDRMQLVRRDSTLLLDDLRLNSVWLP